MKLKLYVPLIAVCLTSGVAQVTRTVCGEYHLLWPQRLPPVSIYMPYDVLLGYIGLDSAVTTSKRSRQAFDQILAFLSRRVTFDDTLRKMVRSMYAMCDYDPMLYAATLDVPQYRVGRIGLDPYMIGARILRAVESAWGSDTANKYRDMALLSADYILHVKIEDTVHALIPGSRWYKNYDVITTCRVLDVLKGQVAPPCNPELTHGGGRGIVKKVVPAPSVLSTDGCLQFVYHPGLRIGGYVDVIYPPWDRYMEDSIYPGKEYMVMLVYAIPCWHAADSLGNRYELTPLMIDMQCENSADWFQVSPAAYAIEEEGGQMVVRMPWNEFGWGTSVPLATFKQRLRSRIAEIRSW